MEQMTADRIMTEDQAKRLLRATWRAKEGALRSGVDRQHVVDHFLFALAWNSGLRIAEISALNWGDIGPDYLVVRRGKGGRPRTVHFGPRTAALLSEYQGIVAEARGRPCAPSEAVFRGQRGRLSRSAIHRRLKAWLQEAGLPPGLSFHSFRHGFATRLLDAGVPLSAVRDQLGHSSVSTTSVYLHFSRAARDRIAQVL